MAVAGEEISKRGVARFLDTGLEGLARGSFAAIREADTTEITDVEAGLLFLSFIACIRLPQERTLYSVAFRRLV